LRYIGQTVKPLSKRLSHHLCIAKSADQTGRSLWIRSLPAPPVIRAIAIVERYMADPTERACIIRYRADGADLVNMTDGGAGNLGWKPSAETKARISAAHKGKKVDPEFMRRLSQGNIGRKATAEHRAKVSQANLRRPPPSEETRAKMSASQRRRRAIARGELSGPA
jgi:hypothetical protein